MAKKVERRLDRDGMGLDREQLVDRFELLVDLSRGLGVAFTEGADHRLDTRADDVRVHAHTTDGAELEERQHEVVVPRVEVEIGLGDDAPRLGDVVIRLLDRPDAGDLREVDDRFRLDFDHDAPLDVVDDDRAVADVGDRAEVLDDPTGGGLVVVRRDDEEPVYAELVRFTRQGNGVSGGVRAGAGDNGAAPAQDVNRDPEQLEPLVVREIRALAGRAGDDEPIGTTLDEVLREFAEALEVDRSIAPERRDDGG